MARYQLGFASAARKDLTGLPREVIRACQKITEGLAEHPRPEGSRQLSGIRPPLWRVRVREWRILYQINDEQLTVTVVRIRHRREVYRGL